MQHRHVDNLREWAPAWVTNASPSGWTASASDHAVMSTQTPASLAEAHSVVPSSEQPTYVGAHWC